MKYRYRPSIHHDQLKADRSIARIKQLVAEGYTYEGIADVLNQENYKTLRGLPWKPENVRQVIYRLRHEAPSWYGLAARRAGFTPIPLQ